MSSVLDEIDVRIAEIEREIGVVAPLVEERARLLRARAGIRGEPEPEVPGLCFQPRITREDVLQYLVQHPGLRAGQIAASLSVGQPAVSAHLYRGKGRLFLRRGERWYPATDST